MRTVFFTGFPGFLASELLPRILAGPAEAEATCLVQPRYAAMARVRAGELTRRYPTLDRRIHLVDGDITEPTLGLNDAGPLERPNATRYIAASARPKTSRECQ